MPLMRCVKDKKPGWKWGVGSKCYTYLRGNKRSETVAKGKARLQEKAIRASGWKENE